MWLKKAAPERNSAEELADPGLQKDNDTPTNEIYPSVKKPNVPRKPAIYPDIVKAEGEFPPAKPPMGMPGKSPMMPPGGPKTEKQDVATADSVIKALKALIAREKSEGEGKDVKKLETALKAVEDFKGGEKKEVEKEEKGEEKKESSY